MAQAQPVPQGTGVRSVRRFEDPLAELARLIGQDDPFADFVAVNKPISERRRGVADSYRPRSIEPRHDERDLHSRAQEDHSHDDQAEQQTNGNNGALTYNEVGFDDRDMSGHEERARPRPNGRPAARQADQRAQVSRPHDDQYEDDYPPQPAQPKARFSRATQQDEYDYPEERKPQPRGYSQKNAYSQNGYDDQYDDDRYEQQAYAEQPRSQKRSPAKAYDGRGPRGRDDNGYNQDYADDAHLPAHADDYYEEAPKKKSGKSWLLVGIAAACIAVLAVTGVFAYRAVFGTSGAPKTIKAETTPSKATPAANTQASEPGKNNDRVGFDSPPQSGERIVSRQEEPVGRAPAPGSSPFAAVPQANQPPRQQAQTQTPVAEGEPKRVRTYSVRADGSVVGDQGRANTTGSTQRQGQVSNAPMSINSYAERDGGSAPAQQAIPQQQARTQQSNAPAPASGNPWADIPNAQPQRAAPPPQQQASVNNSPPPVQRAPAPTIAVQSPLPAGSYVVQVASQKTEQEAQTAWQQVQQRYASVLGGQQAQIRRANLGERGTFYRAQLGPFNDRARASEICENLKAAGGECIIQRN